MKNKSLNWPEGTFTVEDVRNINPDFIDITIRSRISNEINKYNIEHIADISGGKGRPRMLLAKTPILQKHIDEAKEKGAVIRHSVTVTVAELNDTHLPDKDVILKTTQSMNSDKNSDFILN